MKKLSITAIAAVITLIFSAGAVAINMSNDEFKAGKAGIAAEYKAARTACSSFSGNAKDVCAAEARGARNVARAELAADYKPTSKSRHDARVARAEADYEVAREKCDDAAGNAKDICVKEARAVAVAARADAKAQMKISDANQVADDKTSAARAKAAGQRSAAREDAVTDKRNADYAVARERCDAFAGDAKTACIGEARSRFGQ